MNELSKKLQAEYVRNWRKKNKDKVKEYNRRYWEKKAFQKLEQEEK